DHALDADAGAAGNVVEGELIEPAIARQEDERVDDFASGLGCGLRAGGLPIEPARAAAPGCFHVNAIYTKLSCQSILALVALTLNKATVGRWPQGRVPPRQMNGVTSPARGTARSGKRLPDLPSLRRQSAQPAARRARHSARSTTSLHPPD